jgi:hypothetical protein
MVLTLMAAAPAWARQAAQTTVAAVAAVEPLQSAAKPVCTIADKRISGASGLAVVSDGFLVIDSGADTPLTIRIYHLDTHCTVTSVDVRQRQPRDPEDLATGTDGATYIADFGDTRNDRPSIALWRLGPGRATTIYRMSYPDGAKDARAMLLTATNTPIVITVSGAMYAPSSALQPEVGAPGVALASVGRFMPTPTDTVNPLGPAGTTVITGAAVSPGGSKVVIRTYSDAYEWDVPPGADIATTITTSQPRRTPLPNETDGEAIAYSSDGNQFYTVSSRPNGEETIMSYQPTPPAPQTSVPPPSQPPTATETTQTTGGLRALVSAHKLLAVGAALAGLTLLAGMVFIIGRWRRGDEDDDDDYDYADDGHRRPRSGSRYYDDRHARHRTARGQAQDYDQRFGSDSGFGTEGRDGEAGWGAPWYPPARYQADPPHRYAEADSSYPQSYAGYPQDYYPDDYPSEGYDRERPWAPDPHTSHGSSWDQGWNGLHSDPYDDRWG